MSGAPPTTTVVDLLRRTTDLHLTDGILVQWRTQDKISGGAIT
jgi:hypothetical protein